MFSLYVTTNLIIFLTFIYITKGQNEKIILPCFPKTLNVDTRQFDSRIIIKYLNCTRVYKKNLFTITFELQRRLIKFDQLFESNMVVTLFSGPCSSSTATLNIGRTFPSIHGSLDGSDPSSIASSHLPWNGQSQQGIISYEYMGGGADFAQLTSVLIHVVIRYGREDMINGIYVIKFNS